MDQKPDFIGITLISIFLILLAYAGYLSYKSIDWNVLDRLEQAPIEIPTPASILPSDSSPSSAPAN